MHAVALECEKTGQSAALRVDGEFGKGRGAVVGAEADGAGREAGFFRGRRIASGQETRFEGERVIVKGGWGVRSTEPQSALFRLRALASFSRAD